MPLLVVLAVVCAFTVVVLFHNARRREQAERRRLAASVAERRALELAAFAAMVDEQFGTEHVPAPGTIALYTLHPFFELPAVVPRAPVVPRCPLPEHLFRVVQVRRWDQLAAGDAGGVARRHWSATCQACGEHYTEADEKPPPADVAALITAELERTGGGPSWP